MSLKTRKTENRRSVAALKDSELSVPVASWFSSLFLRWLN
jgi:hypothetical protein